MNTRIKQIALRIALLKEEFSENDILQAIQLLEEQSSSSGLLKYLTSSNNSNKTTKDNNIKRKTKKITEQRSKVILELEKNDIEKYKILSPFDAKIREGKIFPTMEDLKTFGMLISKDFCPRKSRRETISELMKLLANQPTEELKEIVKSNNETSQKDDRSNEYQELAHYIINGKSTNINE